jgi:hypothetical protein
MSAASVPQGSHGYGDADGAPAVSVSAVPEWELLAMPDGGALLRPPAWDGPLSPQVIVRLLLLPSPRSLVDYDQINVELLGVLAGGTLLELTATEGSPSCVRVLLAYVGDTTAAIVVQRHQLLSERVVLLASASCAAVDWPVLEQTLERIVASCCLNGEAPDPCPATDEAIPTDPVAIALTGPPRIDGGLRPGRFMVSGELLARLAQDVVASRVRAPDQQLRIDLATAGLTAGGVPDPRVVAAALVRSDPAGWFTLVSSTTASGRTLDGWVSELGITTLEHSESASQAGEMTFTPVVGALPCVLAQALRLRSDPPDRPTLTAEDLTWDELVSPFWSPDEPGWLSGVDEKAGIVFHHLLWSRSDADPDAVVVLVALDAGERGWLTAVPDPGTVRYRVQPCSPRDLWRALCRLLCDLADTAGARPPTAYHRTQPLFKACADATRPR